MNKKHVFLMALVFLYSFSTNAFANYSCSGTVGYLGLNSNGGVVVALTNSTKIHTICSMGTQGAFLMVPVACKAAYATLLAAKVSGASITLYYEENGYTCGTIPDWSGIPSTYFVEGPY